MWRMGNSCLASARLPLNRRAVCSAFRLPANGRKRLWNCWRRNVRSPWLDGTSTPTAKGGMRPMRFCVEQAGLSRFTLRVSSTYRPALSDLVAQGADQAALHEKAARADPGRSWPRRLLSGPSSRLSNFCRENCTIAASTSHSLSAPSPGPVSCEWILSAGCRRGDPPQISGRPTRSRRRPRVVLPHARCACLRRETDLGLGVCCGPP